MKTNNCRQSISKTKARLLLTWPRNVAGVSNGEKLCVWASVRNIMGEARVSGRESYTAAQRQCCAAETL